MPIARDKNMKFSIGKWCFSCSWLLMFLYTLLLILLLNLGFWQLNRADEKRELITQQTEQRQASPLLLSADTDDNRDILRYRKATLTGYYDTTRQILLDNQIFKGKAGYFVLTPFVIAGGKKAVLVNRGWLLANPNRLILPDVTLKNSPTVITGRINHFPSVGIKLVGAEIPTNTTPALIQVVDSQVLAKKLGYALFSFQVELEASAAEGYTREWQTTTLMSPEQHFGYALQWFGLAFALTFLFFWYSCKNTHDE
jgi:surfeit locus 1 family protein